MNHCGFAFCKQSPLRVRLSHRHLSRRKINYHFFTWIRAEIGKSVLSKIVSNRIVLSGDKNLVSIHIINQ